MLTKKAWFKNFDLSFQVNEADVRLKLDNSESVIAYSDFQTIQKKDGYFVMKLDARQTLYLPFQSLADSDFQFIDSQIK